MSDYLYKWTWHAFGFIVIIFIIGSLILLGTSYDVVDFQTRSNIFSERILNYAQSDGEITLDDFSSERLAQVIGGDEATSEVFSARVELIPLNSTSTDITRSYYAKETFERQLPLVNLNNVYIMKTMARYAYLTDKDENVKIQFSFIYKS